MIVTTDNCAIKYSGFCTLDRAFTSSEQTALKSAFNSATTLSASYAGIPTAIVQDPSVKLVYLVFDTNDNSIGKVRISTELSDIDGTTWMVRVTWNNITGKVSRSEQILPTLLDSTTQQLMLRLPPSQVYLGDGIQFGNLP